MRKVISGKIYDTETAEEVCRTEYRFNNSLDDVETHLYRTEKGAFFLAGEGGGLSTWRQPGPQQNTWVGGHGMRLLQEDEARTLVELHCTEQTYTQLFGHPEEG